MKSHERVNRKDERLSKDKYQSSPTFIERKKSILKNYETTFFKVSKLQSLAEVVIVKSDQEEFFLFSC